MKPIIKLPKELLNDILNIYEYGTYEQLEKIEDLFRQQRPQFDAKRHADLIIRDTEEATLESSWSEIFKIRERIKNESKN